MGKAHKILEVGAFVFAIANLGIAIYGGVKAIQLEDTKEEISERYRANELELEEYQEKIDALVDERTANFMMVACSALAVPIFALGAKAAEATEKLEKY